MRWRKTFDKYRNAVVYESEPKCGSTSLFEIIERGQRSYELRIFFVHDGMETRPGVMFDGHLALTNAKYVANTFWDSAERVLRDTSVRK